jgi:alkylated DNA repair dioxygenase AlkB
VLAAAFSETKTSRATHHGNSKPSPSLHVTLQRCFTPVSILENVAASLTPRVDPSGALSSVTLVRLSKQLISLDNKRNNIHENGSPMTGDLVLSEEEKKLWEDGLKNAITCLTSSNWTESKKSLEAFVEGIKGASVISRLLPISQGPRIGPDDGINGISFLWWKPLIEKITAEDNNISAVAQPHHLSGLKWSIDCFQLSIIGTDFSYKLPQSLQRAYDDLDLPFTIRPGFLMGNQGLPPAGEQDTDHNLFAIASFIEQVDFRAEKIQTKSKRAVVERRQTAWQGDDEVPPFEYSGKSMKRMPWSSVVANVRDRLCDETSHYYDGCLLNLYPDGGSGMRYHIDPDQGDKWDFETAVVSIGATRRFAYRAIPDKRNEGGGKNDSKPHLFVLMDGDVTEMVRDCQDRFQHTVKTAEYKDESAPRVSLVFKKTFSNSR